MTETPWPLTLGDGVTLDTSFVAPDGPPPAGGWPAALLVHGHGEDGTKAMTLDRARRLAGRGIAALSMSVRGQGASEGLSFHLGARELFDLCEVIDRLMARPDVDAARVAVCGSSQGGSISCVPSVATGSSTAKPGPAVAISTMWPSGSLV